jgi:DNA-binding transcriptional ArsR family regulator
MRTTAPPLLPLFRSAGQAELLAALFLDPQQEHSIQDLARQADVAYPTAHRELMRLLEAGLVCERRVG